jgi:hypothetical protein
MSDRGELVRELGALASSLDPAVRPAGSGQVMHSLTETARKLFGVGGCSLARLSDSELVSVPRAVASNAAPKGATDAG